MHIEFSDETLNEYMHGPDVYFKNEHKPFEVPNVLGEELLKSLHKLDGALLPVFIRVEAPAKEVLTEAKLKKLGKPALVELAAKMNAGATADNNKDEIVAKILEAHATGTADDDDAANDESADSADEAKTDANEDE